MAAFFCLNAWLMAVFVSHLDPAIFFCFPGIQVGDRPLFVCPRQPIHPVYTGIFASERVCLLGATGGRKLEGGERHEARENGRKLTVRDMRQIE